MISPSSWSAIWSNTSRTAAVLTSSDPPRYVTTPTSSSTAREASTRSPRPWSARSRAAGEEDERRSAARLKLEQTRQSRGPRGADALSRHPLRLHQSLLGDDDRKSAARLHPANDRRPVVRLVVEDAG